MTIGERIKELRAEANLRQSELGKAIGFSGQVVSNVERGYSFPSTEFVNRSAACFGVPADYILGRTTSRYAVADPKEVSAVQARTKARLAQLQMSLPDLIKKSTLTEETCCDILAGKTVPGIDATASLSKALDTSMDYLVGNSEYSCAIASEDEQDIILRYRQLSKKGKRIFLGMMEKMEEEKNRIVYLTGQPGGCGATPFLSLAERGGAYEYIRRIYDYPEYRPFNRSHSESEK